MSNATKSLDTKVRNSNKVYVIGIDSADPKLVETWMAEGRLPCLRSLAEQGTMTKISSIAMGFSDAPWLSFNTGTRPGQHGFYNFLEIDRRTQGIVRVNARGCPIPPFWSLFKNTDKKIGTFDIPKTYPIEGLNGVQISGWGEEYPLIQACSLPEKFLADLSSRFGTYHHPREILNPRLGFQQVRRYRTLMAAIDQKLQAIRYVIKQANDWDLFITSFGEAHYANHLFYHLADPNHWAYDPKLAEQLGEALPNIYTKLDQSLQTLLQDIPEDATVFVVSVHGVATNYSANHLMPEILQKLGLQVNAQSQSSDPTLAKKSFSEQLRSMVPMPIRDFINDWIVPQSFHDKMHSQNFVRSINWDKTQAFFMPIDHFQGFVSLNLKGRDPYGLVDPENYESMCQQIANELKSLVNLDTNKPAVQEVIQTSQLLQGEWLHRLPDLIVQWAEDGPINRLSHPKFGTISGEYYGLRKTQHTGNGFVIAKGKSINPQAEISNAREIDLPPTILSLMGQPIPDYMEGRVLSEMLSNSIVSANAS